MASESACLVATCWYELARFDARRLLRRRYTFALPPARAYRGKSISHTAIRDAFALACCLYWKATKCLQRSVCLARVCRAYGIDARVVIGYRARPFMAHAWVEVHGETVNDSPVYRQRLTVLHTS